MQALADAVTGLLAPAATLLTAALSLALIFLGVAVGLRMIRSMFHAFGGSAAGDAMWAEHDEAFPEDEECASCGAFLAPDESCGCGDAYYGECEDCGDEPCTCWADCHECDTCGAILAAGESSCAVCSESDEWGYVCHYCGEYVSDSAGDCSCDGTEVCHGCEDTPCSCGVEDTGGVDDSGYDDEYDECASCGCYQGGCDCEEAA